MLKCQKCLKKIEELIIRIVFFVKNYAQLKNTIPHEHNTIMNCNETQQRIMIVMKTVRAAEFICAGNLNGRLCHEICII